MKKNLLTLTLFCLAVASLRADVIFNETFNYVNGPIIAVGTNADGSTNWFRHSGTASPSDSIVKNHKQEVSATGGAVTRQDDVHRNFTSFTNTQTIVYSSFTVNCTNLPPAVGTYFAHFYVNTTTFHGRTFAQAGTLPNTWRLGISGAAGTVNKVFPVDLATNTDYQVVVQWDPTGFNAATLWVNPISSGDPSVITGDLVTTPAASTGFGFRQASTFGSFFCNVSNLVVATTFDEAATNVWSTNAVAPALVYQFSSTRTNFVGDNFNLSVVANGQGLGNMVYQWQKDGANISNPNNNSNVFSFPSAAVSDTGNYRVIATTPYSLSVTSVTVSLWVTNPPVPPVISQQPPSNTTVYIGQTATLSLTAGGSQPITYEWLFNGLPVTAANASGADTATLTITTAQLTNAGTYRCIVSNDFGPTFSSNAVLNVTNPPAVSIAYLRTLVDPVNYLATNSTSLWQVTGTVTTFTNLTTGNTSSYYLQDSTAGINIFATFGQAFRPSQGDRVTFVGFLSSFASTLELEADTVNNPATSYTVIGAAPLPAAKVVPFNITNNLAYMETNVEGSIVMLTNVFFGTNAGTVIPAANTTVTVTNDAGETFNLFFSAQDLDTVGQTLPGFAWSVIGPMTQNLGNTITPRNQGYSVTVTRFSDIVTDAPPGVTLTASHSGNSSTLTWTAVPYNYSYSVLASADVTGPYLPIATGLTFTDTAGTYTDVNAAGSLKFYRVVSP